MFVRITADASGVAPGVAVASKSLNGLSVAATKSSAQMNMLRSTLVPMASQFAGLNPMVGRLASTLGLFAVSSGVMAGALAGLAAFGFAWQKITEKTREAKVATEAALDRLRELARVQALGPGGQLGGDLATGSANILAKRAEIERLQSFEAEAGIASLVQARQLAKAQTDLVELLRLQGIGYRELRRVAAAAIEDGIVKPTERALTAAEKLHAKFLELTSPKLWEQGAGMGTITGGGRGKPGAGGLILDPVTTRSTMTEITAMAKETTVNFEVLGGVIDGMMFGASSALADFVMTGKMSFKSFVDSAIRDLLRLAAQMAAMAVFKAVVAAQSGGASIGVDALISGAANASLSPMPGLPSGSLSPSAPSASMSASPLVLDFSTFPQARDPISAARDAQWMKFFDLSQTAWKQSGGRLP